MKAHGLKLRIYNFQADRAKNLAEIGEKPPKSCFLLLLPLSPPRFYNLEPLYLYHMKAPGLKLCTYNFQADRAKNLAEIGEKPPKSCFLLLLPLSPPRFYNLEPLYLYHMKAPGLKLCTWNFQADRAKNLAEIGEKPPKKLFSAASALYPHRFYNPEALYLCHMDAPWSEVVRLEFSGGSRQKFGGNW